MRPVALLLISAAVLTARGETSPRTLWTELKAKREKLPSSHQEFDVTRTFKTAHGTQSSKRQIILDMSQGQWREISISGSGNDLRLFDGENIYRMEEGGHEYVRDKHHPKEEDPLPVPYDVSHPDWSKAVELERLPCGIPKIDHQCVLLGVPLQDWVRPNSPNNLTRMVGGTERMLFDMDTGLLISSRTIQSFDNQRGSYQSDVLYELKRMRYGAPADASLFKLPSGDMKEVNQLSSWNAARIKKQLRGNPAPELNLTDLQGKPLALSAFRGKIVLIDFWTTWCPPCRADGPALEKLYRRYGDKDLMIIGVSVSEDRGVVEKFLSEHPHSFPIVLTSENQMPRAYQIGVFPTYIVIDRDGTVATAAEGDQGFADLRKMLKKAGLETE